MIKLNSNNKHTENISNEWWPSSKHILEQQHKDKILKLSD